MIKHFTNLSLIIRSEARRQSMAQSSQCVINENCLHLETTLDKCKFPDSVLDYSVFPATKKTTENTASSYFKLTTLKSFSDSKETNTTIARHNLTSGRSLKYGAIVICGIIWIVVIIVVIIVIIDVIGIL